MPTTRHALLACLALFSLFGPPSQAAPAAPGAASPGLPSAVRSALAKAGVSAEALAVHVHDLSTGQRVLQWQAQKGVNPASLTKLLTTAAALDRLGPAYTWATPVWVQGTPNNGTLEGNVVLQGLGDPRFGSERVWHMLRRLQQLGIRDIRGDFVLDSSAFSVPDTPAGEFDGEPLRPYNVKPAALLFHHRSVIYSFVPDAAAGVARVLVDPPLSGITVDRTVPLSAAACGDWRTALKASFDPTRVRWAGSYMAACGEQNWAVADTQPGTFEARLIEGLWREMGGTLSGSVRSGTAPDAKPSFELRSPALAELVRDINKFSNNLMAQQLFLTLALHSLPKQPATAEAARETLQAWLLERTGALRPDEELFIDNGSGLSRLTRLSAERLGLVLQQAWDGPVMSELMASLPITGLDGTLRRSRAAVGRGHLKTGSLRDVAAVAGYVLSNSGKRYVVVAIAHHPQASAARPAIDALVQWVSRDAPSGAP